MKTCSVAIIGAGPYGLSIAAHLAARGIDFRIFGSPMHTWNRQMPKGMRLKSEGFASSLYDPDSALTLERYCEQQGIPYKDTGLPVALETFVAYGLAFQKRFAPGLENKIVVSLRQSSGGFEIRLEDGEIFVARQVVVAVGLSYFEHVPAILSQLSEEFVTHSSRHNTLDQFAGREVIVVGAGASALDLAALLHQAGASVQLVARKPAIRFHDPPPIRRRLKDRVQYPMTGIGLGWKLVFCAHAPSMFQRLPVKFRLDAVRRILGPAPGWFIKQEVVGKVPFNLGFDITRADMQNGRVSLELTDQTGTHRTLTADHVIAATGYKVDLRRLTFFDPDIQATIHAVEYTPALSSNFESSVPGLYFVGTAAANAFGPLMRFAFGARFTARRLARHLGRSLSSSLTKTESPSSVSSKDLDRVLSR